MSVGGFSLTVVLCLPFVFCCFATQEDDDHGAALPVEVTSLQLDGWKVRSLSCGGVHSAAILTRQSE